jgi:SAM-dependent methyltransferase
MGIMRGLVMHDLLDVGCGEGDAALEIRRSTGARVSCVDISDIAVESCTRRGLDAQQVDISSDPLPFDDEQFDAIYLAEVIEHLIQPDRALRDMWRVLRPGGHLVVSTPNLACLPNRILLAVGLQPLFSEVSEEVVLGRGAGIFGQGGSPVGHLRLYTRRGLVEMLRLHGFEPVDIRGAAFSDDHLGIVQRVVSSVPSLAMILVVLARKIPAKQ